MRRVCEKALLLIAALAIVASTSDPSSAQMMGRENASAKKKHTAYVQTNLVSDGTVTANTVDPNLKNPWGLAFFPGLSPFWVADNNGFVSTLYDGMGVPFPPPPAPMPLVVNIPLPNGPTGGAPSGLVANIFAGNTTVTFPTPGTGKPSLFLFDTEDGTVVAWNTALADLTHAVIAVDNSSHPTAAAGAVYKGLAIAANGHGAPQLYATNFRSGKIDVFDSNFMPVTLSTGAFTDSNLPKGFAPFGIQSVVGNLWVTYARQDKAKHDPINKPAHGVVDIFDTDGNMIQRFATHGHLDSPWGVTIAPSTFGEFANDFMIGNFGDGKINAYDSKGKFEGKLRDGKHKTIVNESLWALSFGGALNSSVKTLYFTAGLHKEKNGVFGAINPK